MTDLPSGVSELELIRENQRYSTYRASFEGHPVFVKQMNDPELAPNVQRETEGLKLFGKMADQHDIGFVIPRLVLRGEDFVVTSWAEGQPMNTDNGDVTPDRIEFLANSLVAMDKYASPGSSDGVIFNLDTASAAESVEVLRARLDKADLPDYVDPGLLKQAFGYVEEHVGKLKPRLAHADVHPGNILEFEGQRTLIDFEFTSEAWPRFYDLVNLTSSRIILFPTIAAEFKRLAERYFELNNADDHKSDKTQINTIAMYRALSLAWELTTEPNRFHNTGQKMTPETYGRLAGMIKTILSGEFYFGSL